MFGQTVYKQRPPDQKATSKHALTARSSRQVKVANQAESSLHGSRRKSLQLSYFSSHDTSAHTNCKDSEEPVKEYGNLKSESKYSNEALCTPRSLGELRLPRTPRMHATASGMLPSCSLSGGKSKPDSYLSNHQRYPIRAKQPAVPPIRDKQSDAHHEQGATKSPKKVKEKAAESEELDFPDFDTPFDIQQFEFSRKAFKKLIRDKIFWGRYEPDGHGSFKLRGRPKLLKIQQEAAVQLAGSGKETGHRSAHHYDAAARHGDVFRARTSLLLASKTSVRMWITLLVHTQICIKFGRMIDELQQTYHPSAAAIQRTFRQWDRAVIFLRSKGKVWRISNYYLHHSNSTLNNSLGIGGASTDGSRSQLLSSEPKTPYKQVRLAGSQRVIMKKPVVDEAIALHNTIHVTMDPRQTSLLGRINKFPNVKWQTLYSEFRRKQSEHVRALREHEQAVREYRESLMQKQMVESVLRGLTEDDERDRGSDVQPPSGSPRFKPCLHPSIMQESISQALSSIIKEHRMDMQEQAQQDHKEAWQSTDRHMTHNCTCLILEQAGNGWRA
ncbi:hypothetical protein GUITHDRAFT_133784 [Guillardia theta CCMP2712]|uniref:Uncharacterized protein n=1 Tax=Guillardia theta (strain CCMP2712) TaxID=905079 RepID=L1JUZ5_GUITC|nr:hypothetical protein GUITHDRAFT_133784 [Guillardia theta CCMP2712]EKX52030.1 hypothetical protein GUITHDRAFT_133784 [Guillardia theta CCMP2712]|eukprot:XP_005839010.1 hypothetical protein GUITHDRAFT_133784 [Guillardia theta CCMP2712]